MPADPLGRVRRATTRRSHAETEWRDAIREAVKAGESLRVVGKAAGVTHWRVLQLTRD